MKRQHGFTLIELIAALAILAVLAALITVTASAALKYMRGVSAGNDIDQVVKALEIYKQKYGEYPPDGTDREAVERHIKKRWVGSIGQTLTGTDEFTGAAYPDDTNAADYMGNLAPLENNTYFSGNEDKTFIVGETTKLTMGADRSLSFWLCGLGNEQSEKFLSILNDSNAKLPEVANPVLELKNGQNYFEEINAGSDLKGGWLTDSKGNKFVYFRARKNGYTDVPAITIDGVTIEPFAKADGTWYAADTYQLRFAGEDGALGTKDDLTNFSNGKTIGDLENE